MRNPSSPVCIVGPRWNRPGPGAHVNVHGAIYYTSTKYQVCSTKKWSCLQYKYVLPGAVLSIDTMSIDARFGLSCKMELRAYASWCGLHHLCNRGISLLEHIEDCLNFFQCVQCCGVASFTDYSGRLQYILQKCNALFACRVVWLQLWLILSTSDGCDWN